VPATALVFDVFMPSAGIRLLALGRTAARYGERLVTHDATLAVLAALRERLFRSWAPPVPPCCCACVRHAAAAPDRRCGCAGQPVPAPGRAPGVRLGAALLAAVVLGAMRWWLGLLLGLWLLLVGTGIAMVLARRAAGPHAARRRWNGCAPRPWTWWPGRPSC
jgi:ATP-binding cassette subfamily C protein CydC